MPKKTSRQKKADVPFTLKAFTKILERTTNTLEQRVIAKLTSDLAAKEELKEGLKALEAKIDRKPDVDVVERIVNLEMNKAAEVISQNLKELDEKLEDRNKRFQKLETATFHS